MCSTSKVNDALKGLSSSTSNTNVPSIPSHKIKQHRDQYFLVDIREPNEIEDEPFPDADLKMTMGAVCHKKTIPTQDANKTIVLVCGSERRAQTAAEFVTSNQKVAYLQRGLIGWNNPSAVSPHFMVVLGTCDSSEKLSLALAAAANATDVHDVVVLVLMSDAVQYFIKPESPKAKESKVPHVSTVHHGDPFKPCKAMLSKFLSSGGIILTCTTCVIQRGLSFEKDMDDTISPMQMPDLVRMLGEAKGGNLQFL